MTDRTPADYRQVLLAMCECPNCGADMRGGTKLPDQCEPDEKLCRWGCGRKPHYTRLLQFTERNGSQRYKCPDCDKEWIRP